jgi:hypothetical protein
MAHPHLHPLRWQNATRRWLRRMRYSPQGASVMWLALAIILILLWVGGFLLFHIAAFALHILLIIAAVALVIHLVSGGRRVV